MRARTAVARLVLGLAAAGAVTVIGAGPAAAHECAEPITIVEGEETTVSIGVTTGDEGTGDLLVMFDESFEVTADAEVPGWDVSHNETSVNFRGGPLEPGTCTRFDIPVKAGEPGTFRVRAFQRLADDTVVEHPADDEAVETATGSVIVDRTEAPNEAWEQIIEVTPGPDDGLPVGLLVGGAAAVVLLVAVWRLSARSTRRP